MSLSDNALAIFEARGFDPEAAVYAGIETVERGAGEWVMIPYLRDGAVVNRKYRTIGKPDEAYEKRMAQDADAEKVFWNIDVLHDASLADQPLFITEGEFDALALMESGYLRTMSVPDGAPNERAEDVFRDRQTKYSYVFDVMERLRDVKEIILATDSDHNGIILRDELAHILGRARCKWLPYPRDAERHGEACKDAADVLLRYGRKGIDKCVERASWLKSDGVYAYSDLPPQEERRVYRSGVAGGLLDERLRVRLGDLMVVLGIPSFGKSTFLNEFCCSLARKHQWKPAFFTPEQYTSDHYKDLMQWVTGKDPQQRSADETQRAEAWIEENIRWIEGGDEEDRDVNWIIEKAEQAIIQHQCKIIVIDPWNELDHYFGTGMSETEYTGRAIKELKRLAKRFNVLVIVAHHPRKMMKKENGSFHFPTPYDASGSAHWFNKADEFVVIHREGDQTTIRVEKLKKHGIMGKPGDLEVKFDRTRLRYYGGGSAEAAA